MKAITRAKGFLAYGMHCGIKLVKLDLALIYSKVSAKVAGVFTANKFKAAPLLLTQQLVKKGQAQAIIMNSGSANCATGKQGMADARTMSNLTKKVLGLKDPALVASTGVIGRRLPIDKIKQAIPDLVLHLSTEGGDNAAKAILTTDRHVKESYTRIKIGKKKITIGGIAKGAGMIEPNMATMLGFITTDAVIALPALKRALKNAVDESFNKITVDGCQSTNDMVLVMANGLAKNKIIKSGKNLDKFTSGLEKVCADLAKMIVADGEGATKFVEVKVIGARNKAQAGKIARVIANCNLLKCALHGSKANWGRVVAVLGSTAINFDARKVKIKLAEKLVFSNNEPIKINQHKMNKAMKARDIKVEVDLSQGTKEDKCWTCDLSSAYVRINS